VFAWTRVRSAGLFLLWTFLSGVIVAAFFVTSFFGDYGPVRLADPGTVILFMPVFTAFILGLLLADYELVHTVVAALLSTFVAIGLILGFMYAPAVAGVAVGPPPYQGAFSSVLLFPLVLLGTVVGRAIGERILPPAETQRRQRALEAETREWHERLTEIEGRSPSEDRGKRP